MNYQSYEPVDPRDAFTVAARPDAEGTQSAAAAGARETTRLRKTIRRILENGTESTDQLVAGVAREVLGQIDPQNEHLQPHVGGRTRQELRDVKSHTAVVTHGTWARDGAWYQPGGDFYVGLSQNRPDLHLQDQSFQWSGGYSHGARRLGAIDLEQWLVGQQLATPDFFSHSHGGTVAHLATGRGVTFDRLVLMGWPVLQQWFPDFSKVNRIVDVRVRADLVILADRGGQRFRTNQFNVEEHRHGWFNHFSTHESEYWDHHDLWDAV